jgi:tetratricopeptide (TPR) repeat protein
VDPNHPTALEQYSTILMALGRVKEAVALKRRGHDLDPFIPVRNNNYAEALWLDGQTDAAIALLKDGIGRVGRPGIGSETDLARIYAAMGRYEDAAQTLSLIVQSQRPQEVKDSAAAAIRLLRSAPAKSADPDAVPRSAQFYSMIYLYLGMPERALAPYEQGDPGFAAVAYLWHPSYAPLRKLDRFKKIIRDQGFVEYWRERGWPDLCHPTTGDDFVCE